MRTVALISQKGGVGKTTLTINLAAAAQQDGLQVVIADTDPQQSTYEWYRGRREQHPLPYVAQAFPKSIGDVIEKAERNGADLLVIDTSPNSTEESLAVAERADLLIVPCAPSFIDLRALKRTEKIIQLSAKPAYAVLNLCPPVGDDAEQAEQALAETRLSRLSASDRQPGGGTASLCARSIGFRVRAEREGSRGVSVCVHVLMCS